MTYAEAKKAANKNHPNVVYRGDSGGGWTFEVYFCPRRNRQVWTSINPNGMRIV